MNNINKNITLENGNDQRVLEEYRSINDTNYSIDLRYIYGSFVDDVLGFYKGSYQFYYHHSDRQYNSRCLTDWARRAIEYTSYTPYGSRIIDTRWYGKNRTTSAYDNTLGFTGRHYEKESGLYYFRARYYDSSQGRFISRDPAGYIDGMGLYNGYFASRFMMDPSGYISVTRPIPVGRINLLDLIAEHNSNASTSRSVPELSYQIISSAGSSCSNNIAEIMNPAHSLIGTLSISFSDSMDFFPSNLSSGSGTITLASTNEVGQESFTNLKGCNCKSLRFFSNLNVSVSYTYKSISVSFTEQRQVFTALSYCCPED